MRKLSELGTTPQDFNREGLKQEAEVWEDGNRIGTEPGEFEWWYFDAHMDDGSTVVAIFFTKSYSNINVPLSPQVKLSITTPSGKTYLKLIDFPGNVYSSSNKQCDVKVDNNWIKGDLKHYTMHIALDDIAADLEFTRVVPSWRAGTGKCSFGTEKKDFFAWFVPIPFGNVSGKVTYEGAEHMITGTGYHDHNWGNISLRKVIDHWYWGRLNIGDYKVIFFQMFSTKKYGSECLPLFMFAKNDKIMTGDGTKLTLEKKNFTSHAPSGKTYAKDLKFKWQDGDDAIIITTSNPEVIDVRSLLSDLPFLKRKGARLFTNPHYFRFNADTEIDVNFGEIKENIKEKALYEIMMLH